MPSEESIFCSVAIVLPVVGALHLFLFGNGCKIWNENKRDPLHAFADGTCVTPFVLL